MTPLTKSKTFRYPRWLQFVCCLSPIVCLPLICISAAFGVSVSPYVAIPVVALNARVIAAALGINVMPLIHIERPLQASNKLDAISRE